MALTVTFKNPVTFEENTVESIELDLDSLTGRDMSQIKSEWAQAGKFSPVPATDLDFCIMVAARASKQPIEFFEQLKSREWLKVAQEVSNFLMS